jgi:hypothetical protein
MPLQPIGSVATPISPEATVSAADDLQTTSLTGGLLTGQLSISVTPSIVRPSSTTQIPVMDIFTKTSVLLTPQSMSSTTVSCKMIIGRKF